MLPCRLGYRRDFVLDNRTVDCAYCFICRQFDPQLSRNRSKRPAPRRHSPLSLRCGRKNELARVFAFHIWWTIPGSSCYRRHLQADR